MFNLFPKISSDAIAAFVRRVLDQYMRDHDLEAAVSTLIRFADQYELGAWRRTKFAAEISTCALRRGLCARAALAFGEGFGAFVDRRLDGEAIHWTAYTAGMEGAVRFREGWTEHACKSVGSVLIDDYILNPDDRANILRSYELGWLACDDADIAAEATLSLKLACAAEANFTTPPSQSDRHDEISETAVHAYRLRRATVAAAERA